MWWYDVDDCGDGDGGDSNGANNDNIDNAIVYNDDDYDNDWDE